MKLGRDLSSCPFDQAYLDARPRLMMMRDVLVFLPGIVVLVLLGQIGVVLVMNQGLLLGAHKRGAYYRLKHSLVGRAALCALHVDDDCDYFLHQRMSAQVSVPGRGDTRTVRCRIWKKGQTFCGRACQGAPFSKKSIDAKRTYWCWAGTEGRSQACKTDADCMYSLPCTSGCGGNIDTD